MNESIIALVSALGLLISAATGIYVAVTAAKTKHAEVDDIYSQINGRIQKQYETLLKAKGHQVETLDLRISALEQDRQADKGEIKLLLSYISYLLEEIKEDKNSTLKVISLEAYRLVQEAGV